MNPEISRRCPTCGASIRERDALFCPECGNSLTADSPGPADREPRPGRVAETVEAHRVDDRALNDGLDGSEEYMANSSGAGTAVKSATPSQHHQPEQVGYPARQSEQKPAPRSHPRVAERTRETLHRASSVARGVIEDEVKRVEKIRQVSSVVIEEASYDPSLRFVLVALGLFILFLILLVVSKLMG